MATSVEQAIAEIGHAVSGQPEREALRLVNEAGTHLTSMHAWNYLIRPSTQLASVAGQAYIDLPADFGEILGIQLDGGYLGNWEYVDPGFFTQLEATSWSGEGPAYWTIIEWPVKTDGSSPTPRLALHPAPASTDASFATLRYRAKWADLSRSDREVPVPDYCRSLFLALCRAFARGYDEDEQVTLSQRLADVEIGSLLDTAKRADGRTRRRMGVLRNGAAGSLRRRPYIDIGWGGNTP